MKGKSGWIRILEATIAVLIVSGSILVVYSKNPSTGQDIENYVYETQREILSDIAMDSELRLAVLNVVDESSSDGNYSEVDNFVEGRVPSNFGYSVRVCDLEDEGEYCKMDSDVYKKTMEYDVFVEDILIAAEVGEGGGKEVYSPKKVRLFFWI